MQGPRRQLLAGSAFSFHENRRTAHGRLGDQVEHLAHARTAADDVPQPVVLRPETLAKRAVLGHQPPLLGRVAHHHQHFFVLERLGDVVERAAFHGRDRVLERCVGGDQNDRQVLVEPAQPVQRLNPTDARHHHVDDGDVEPLPASQLQPLVTGDRGRHATALAHEQRLQDVTHDLLVVDDQHGRVTKHGNGPPTASGVATTPAA